MLGPIEILVLAFPDNDFHGEIAPELARVVADGTITIIDGLFVMLDESHTPTFYEFDQLGVSDEVSSLTTLIDRIEGLVSDDDVTALTESLPSNSSAVILVFEHTWVVPLRNAIAGAGGVLLESIRVPGATVEELLETVPDEN